MNNLRHLLEINVVNLELVMMQIYLNANDYSLKFHMSKLPKLPYIAAGFLTLNLTIFGESNHRTSKLTYNTIYKPNFNC